MPVKFDFLIGKYTGMYLSVRNNYWYIIYILYTLCHFKNLSKNEEFLNGVTSAIGKDKSSISDLQYILHRLLFILTAINEDIKNIVVDRMNGRHLLASCLENIMKKFTPRVQATALHRK